MKPILRSPAISKELIEKQKEFREAIKLDAETLTTEGWQKLTYETVWEDKEDGWDECFDIFFQPSVVIDDKFIGALFERWYEYVDDGEVSTGNELYLQFEQFLATLKEEEDYICLRTRI